VMITTLRRRDYPQMLYISLNTLVTERSRCELLFMYLSSYVRLSLSGMRVYS
jgi:hypothetical protein